MKNTEVDNYLIDSGFEEIRKVTDWYQIAGWIVPCQKCGTWLTSLGLCSDCGTRFEVVEVNSLNEAAPDLLEACKLALGAFENNNAIDWSILEKAIAKARPA